MARAGGKRQPARCSRKTQDKFAIASMAKKLVHRCTGAHADPVASVYANVFADVHNTCLTYIPAHAWCSEHLSECIPHFPQKMHMHPCMRAHATVTVQKLLCHGSYSEFILSLARASCRLSFPPVLLLSRPNQSPVAVRSRNPSKSTLAHDAVTAVVSHKLHSIIRVGAGLIQFVYGSHSRLAVDLILHKVLFSPWFSRAQGFS